MHDNPSVMLYDSLTHSSCDMAGMLEGHSRQSELRTFQKQRVVFFKYSIHRCNYKETEGFSFPLYVVRQNKLSNPVQQAPSSYLLLLSRYHHSRFLEGSCHIPSVTCDCKVIKISCLGVFSLSSLQYSLSSFIIFLWHNLQFKNRF